MFREIVQIMLAIQLSAGPHYPAVRAEHLAKVIQSQSEAVDVDPLMIVAIAEHESHFNARAVSPDGLDYGLLQIRAKYYGGKPEWLFDETNNIKAGVYIIRKSMEVCRRILKREPTTQEWLSVYQGSLPSCKPTKLTKIVYDYAQCLIDLTSGDAETQVPASACTHMYWLHN